MKRRFVLISLLVLLAIVGLGYISWPFNGPFRFVCGRLEKQTGWKLSAQDARWVPWHELNLRNLKVQSPVGGRLQLVRLAVSPKAISLFKGMLQARLEFEDIRMEPGSWGIRIPAAQKTLSAGAVARNGYAVIEIKPGLMTLRPFAVRGSFVNLDAEGWLSGSRQTHLSMEGEFSRQILVEMNLMKSEEQPSSPLWEPFYLRVDGTLSRPVVSFSSNFFTLSLNDVHGEQRI